MKDVSELLCYRSVFGRNIGVLIGTIASIYIATKGFQYIRWVRIAFARWNEKKEKKNKRRKTNHHHHIRPLLEILALQFHSETHNARGRNVFSLLIWLHVECFSVQWAHFHPLFICMQASFVQLDRYFRMEVLKSLSCLPSIHHCVLIRNLIKCWIFDMLKVGNGRCIWILTTEFWLSWFKALNCLFAGMHFSIIHVFSTYKSIIFHCQHAEKLPSNERIHAIAAFK